MSDVSLFCSSKVIKSIINTLSFVFSSTTYVQYNRLLLLLLLLLRRLLLRLLVLVALFACVSSIMEQSRFMGSE